MGFETADLHIVEDAIRTLAAGTRVTELRFTDRIVRYESATMNDLLKLRDQIQADLRRAPGGRARVARLYRAGRGF